MFKAVFIIVLFALLYALKGGSGKDIFPWWAALRARNKITERLLDGKVISTLGVFIFGIAAFGGLLPSLYLALGWLAAVTPSMGEEHGAVGRIGHAWGEYIDKGFGRGYGIKKAVQRGVWMGACMAFATSYLWFIPLSLLYVPAVFVGQELSWRILRRDGWVLAEPIIGALVFGLGMALLVGGV